MYIWGASSEGEEYIFGMLGRGSMYVWDVGSGIDVCLVGWVEGRGAGRLPGRGSGRARDGQGRGRAFICPRETHADPCRGTGRGEGGPRKAQAGYTVSFVIFVSRRVSIRICIVF